MAIQNYIGWATNVNKVILDSTNILIGKDAIRKEEGINGKKNPSLKGSYVGDEFSVVMDFNYVDKVGNTGKTEYQLFYEWYKYRHKFGTVPFSFPQILYSPQTGVAIEDSNPCAYEFYKITSAVDGSKRGHDIRVKMTWESVYSGVVQVDTPVVEISRIGAIKGNYIDVVFTQVADTEPNSSEFKLFINDKEVSLEGFWYSAGVARLYYQDLAVGTHTVTFSFLHSASGYQIQKGTFIASIEV